MKPHINLRFLHWLAMLATPICSPTNVQAQLVPTLAGQFEDVWSSERGSSWLEGPSYGHGGIWLGDPGNIFLPDRDPTRLMRFDIETGLTSAPLDLSRDPNIFGTEFDGDGRLVSTHLGSGTVTRRNVNALDQPEILANGFTDPKRSVHTERFGFRLDGRVLLYKFHAERAGGTWRQCGVLHQFE